MRTNVLLGVALLRLTCEAPGCDLVQLESTYLGEGVCEYRLRVPDDRYFEKVEALQLSLYGLEGRVQTVEMPANWFGESGLVGTVSWRHDAEVSESVPYEGTFRLWSWEPWEPSFRLSEAAVAFRLRWHSWARPADAPADVFGFANFSCLVPCPAEKADGSPTTYVAASPGFPEFKLRSLTLDTDHRVVLSFIIGLGLPVGIEASDDLRHWTQVGTATGARGVTRWVSDVASQAAWRFYRLVVGRPGG